MIQQFILVAIGGALGSAGRFGCQWLFTSRYPEHFYWGTFFVNLVGCFIIGIIYALSLRSAIAENTRLFLMTGICGGFTTFSAFSHEAILLLRQQKLLPFAIYVAFSVFICLLATFLGFRLAR